MMRKTSETMATYLHMRNTLEAVVAVVDVMCWQRDGYAWAPRTYNAQHQEDTWCSEGQKAEVNQQMRLWMENNEVARYGR